MPKKIRVYELGRELGLTNKEALDLCIALGIGVKSHSSSIEDQQADRVRRKADRDGLRRDKQPEEEVAPAAVAAATNRAGDRPTAGTPDGLVGGTPPLAAEPPVLDPARPPIAPRPSDQRLVSSRPTAEAPGPVRREPTPTDSGRPIPPPPARSAPIPPPPRPATPPPRPNTGPAVVPPRPSTGTPATRPASVPAPSNRPQPQPGSSGPAGAPAFQPVAAASPQSPPRPAAPPSDGPTRPATTGQRPSSPPPPRSPAPPGAGQQRPSAGGPPGTASQPRPPSGGPGAPANRRPPSPLSATGKPIPPPPGVRRPPLSPTGKPIPPPPGGNRSTTGPRPTGTGGPPRPGGGSPRPGGGTSGPRPGGFSRPGGGSGGASPGGFQRPGGGIGTGGGRPGGGPGGPGGGGGGRPGGGFQGRGGQQRPQRRRRRRRNLEELEAQELTTYTPSHAPVPDGEVIIERGSTAQELGPRLNRSAADVVRFLLQQGEMVTATQSLGDDMIELFAAEVGAAVKLVDPGEEKEAQLQAKYFDDDEDEDEELLRPRPPVVTVMGHVDHGKTLLLDRIRSTNVVAGEAGGITQHIGAYQVDHEGQLITFIDTPGHEAFTAMRARGAQVTDIVVLVVAADDGVMPQTIEALNHAKAADVPIIVAINKIDREDADPTRVMQQLSELGLVPEQWGGDTIMVEVSALQNLGVDDVLEQILVVAEVEELRANPEGHARGVVLEANLDPGKGPVATVIVQNGTLRVRDSVVAGAAWGGVKALIDDKGDNVKEAPPSTPVQILGFDSVPAAGDEFRVTDKAKMARDIAEQRELRYRAADLRRTSSAAGTGAKLEDIFEQIQRGETATLNVLLKADVQGSLEAVTESLRKLERDEVKLAFVHRAVGGITENDVTLAAASNATIIGFNVRPDRKSRALAEAQDVEIRTYEIIYKLIEDIESAMVGMLTPEYEEVITGDAEVREIFRVPRVGAIAGCYVLNGVITRGSKVRFLRDGVIIWKGAITSLKRFKDDVREVATGFECGIGLSNNQDLRPGDIIETFEEREIPRT